jgi:ribosomal protein S18 acetylase RimI-like enzyme
MRRDMSVPLPPAIWPEGIAPVAFTSALAAECRALMNAAYGVSVPVDTWWGAVSADDEYDPSLMLAAGTNGRLVGFCHGWSVPFIKDLVVDAGTRTRGVGAALLLSVLARYAARNATSVDLKTDVTNLTAQALYHRLGFTIVERVG